MNGRYNIVLNTPMGVERGILQLDVNGNFISGSINARGSNNPFSGGYINGNSINFSGELRISFMKIQYSASCTIQNGNINGVVKTKYGNFKVSGTKI